MQEQLAQVNTSADRRVTPLLRPGRQPGTTEVDLNVEDKLPLHGSLELNNAYSPNTTHLRLNGSLSYDNLFQRDHRASLQFQVSPQDIHEVAVLSGSYLVPLPSSYLSFSLVRSDSNTAAGVGGITVFGRGSIYGLRHIVPLPGDAELAHSISYGIDYKNFKQAVAIGAAAAAEGEQGFETPVHYAPLSIDYSASRSSTEGRWDYGIGSEFALRGFLSEQGEFEQARSKARSNFWLVKFNLARTQPLPGGLVAYGKVDGQWATQPLVSNEQYVAGGADSVRGYLDATQAADSALHVSLEMRSPNLAAEKGPLASSWLSDLTLIGFSDGAYLESYDPLPHQQVRFGLLSVGVGLRMKLKQLFSMKVDLAGRSAARPTRMRATCICTPPAWSSSEEASGMTTRRKSIERRFLSYGRSVAAPVVTRSHVGLALLAAVGALVCTMPSTSRAQAAGTVLPRGTLPVLRGVVSGQAVVGAPVATATGAKLTITQTSPQVLIDWKQFNIANGSEVFFDQASSTYAALNRIYAADPSIIQGKLSGKGQIFLINQNGILFDRGAQINVNTLYASTLNISNGRFANGVAGTANSTDPAFAGGYDATGTTIDAKSGSILVGHHGDPSLPAPQITSASGGAIVLIAPVIDNKSGVIASPDGQVILAAGSKAFLQFPAAGRPDPARTDRADRCRRRAGQRDEPRQQRRHAAGGPRQRHAGRPGGEPERPRLGHDRACNATDRSSCRRARTAMRGAAR